MLGLTVLSGLPLQFVDGLVAGRHVNFGEFKAPGGVLYRLRMVLPISSKYRLSTSPRRFVVAWSHVTNSECRLCSGVVGCYGVAAGPVIGFRVRVLVVTWAGLVFAIVSGGISDPSWILGAFNVVTHGSRDFPGALCSRWQ